MYDPAAIAPAESEYVIERADDGYVSSPYRLLTAAGELELPIGCQVDGINMRDAAVVGMTGDEEDMLGNPRTRDPMTRLIAQCTTRLGGLELPQDDRTPEQRQQMFAMVRSLTMADLTFLLIAIRRVSFVDGDTYRFHVMCPSKHCERRRNVHSVDLSSLTINPAGPTQARQFSFSLPVSKRVVRYQLLQATDIDRLLGLGKQHPESSASVAIYARIIDVDGKKLGSYADTKRWSSADRDALTSNINDSDKFGIDLRVQVDNCPSCGSVMQIELDVGPSFFRPTLAR